MLARVIVLFLLLLPVAATAVPTVAIADLSNDTGDAQFDSAGKGVASILVSKFSRVQSIQVVERARLQEILGEIELGASGVLEPATAARAGKLLGAQYVVLGSIFSVHMPAVSVSLRVVDVQTGKVEASSEVVGTVGEGGSEFFVLIDELAYSVLDALQVRLAAKERIEFGQVEVRQLDTVSLYGKALDALDDGDGSAAESLLSRAMALEPDFKLAEATLERLAAQIGARRTVVAHASLDRARQAWAFVLAEVEPLAKAPKPADALSLVHMGVRARLHLIDGEFDAYFALEDRRVALTTDHFDALIDAKKDWTSVFRSELKRLRVASGEGNASEQATRGVEAFPYQVRMQQAGLMLLLGQRKEGIERVIQTYQHPGPTHRYDVGPENIGRWFRDHDVIDMQLVVHQQAVRQLEIEGYDDPVTRAVMELERLVRAAQSRRESINALREVQLRLGSELASERLMSDEARAVGRAYSKMPEKRLAGYSAFMRRVDGGYYASLIENRSFKVLATAYRSLMDRHFNQPYMRLMRLQHLLDYHRIVPAAEGEEARRQSNIEQLMTGFW